MNFTLPALFLDESAIAIAKAIVSAPTPVAADRNAALRTVRMWREAQSAGQPKIHPRALSWLDQIEKTVETIPENESGFIGEMMGSVDTNKVRAGRLRFLTSNN